MNFRPRGWKQSGLVSLLGWLWSSCREPPTLLPPMLQWLRQMPVFSQWAKVFYSVQYEIAFGDIICQDFQTHVRRLLVRMSCMIRVAVRNAAELTVPRDSRQRHWTLDTIDHAAKRKSQSEEKSKKSTFPKTTMAFAEQCFLLRLEMRKSGVCPRIDPVNVLSSAWGPSRNCCHLQGKTMHSRPRFGRHWVPKHSAFNLKICFVH